MKRITKKEAELCMCSVVCARAEGREGATSGNYPSGDFICSKTRALRKLLPNFTSSPPSSVGWRLEGAVSPKVNHNGNNFSDFIALHTITYTIHIQYNFSTSHC